MLVLRCSRGDWCAHGMCALDAGFGGVLLGGFALLLSTELEKKNSSELGGKAAALEQE